MKGRKREGKREGSGREEGRSRRAEGNACLDESLKPQSSTLMTPGELCFSDFFVDGKESLIRKSSSGPRR